MSLRIQVTPGDYVAVDEVGGGGGGQFPDYLPPSFEGYSKVVLPPQRYSWDSATPTPTGIPVENIDMSEYTPIIIISEFSGDAAVETDHDVLYVVPEVGGDVANLSSSKYVYAATTVLYATIINDDGTERLEELSLYWTGGEEEITATASVTIYYKEV